MSIYDPVDSVNTYKILTYIWNCASPAGIDDFNASLSISLHPNPFSEYCWLTFEKTEGSNYSLMLIDAQGRLMHSINNITTGKVKIERGNLASGLYFFQLHTGREIHAAGKLMIE